MKINVKIIGLLVISFFLVSALFISTAIYALKQSQTENVRLFKEEFLELGRELFDGSSNLFFYHLDMQTEINGKNQTPAQSILKFIKETDPQGKSAVVINIADKRFLEGYSNPAIVTLLDQPTIEKYLQENILSQKTDFGLDNFNEFALDTTNTITPSKIHLRIYNDAGLIIGYNKTFTTAKVRIQFIERQNEILFNFYLVSSLVIFMITVIMVVIFMIISMQNIVIKPLKMMAFGLKQVQEGKLETKLDISKKDEMGQIAIAFNGMTGDLKRSRGELEDYAKNLEEKVKERTKELENKNQELNRLNKILEGLKLKTEFLRVINHQLRTPISAMRGYLEFWRTGKYKNFPLKKQEEIKNNIIIASDQLADIVNNMVAALELEIEDKEIKLDLKNINLKQLVEEIYKVDFEQHFQDKKIAFELVSEKEPVILSDKNFISTVISNLLDNAVKYTLKGKVTVKFESSGNYTIIKVEDTGIGLSESDKAILFQKFTRSEEAIKLSPAGSGLGLFIVKKMIELLHGEITAESKGRNQGSAFTVKLPNYHSNENN